MGTLMGAGRQSGLIDENGEVIHMQEALMADAISTAAGALVGTSTVTTVVESSAGIAAGGRTGMTSLVTAALFLGAIIFAPVVSIVPAAATAPALIFVGVLMLSNIKDVDFSDMTNGLPAFCTEGGRSTDRTDRCGICVPLCIYDPWIKGNCKEDGIYGTENICTEGKYHLYKGANPI